ncbi:MAG: hypothetical protein WCC95_03535 [Candidatus Sulfotelmatobacter sp.]
MQDSSAAITLSEIPMWHALYESAILEPDYSKLPQRIAEARTAIHDRAEEILTSPSCTERVAINNALRVLRALEEVVRKRLTA